MSHSILIVEDERNLGDTLTEYLQSLGHTTFLATNVTDANTIFKKEAPTIILMDIGLPDGSGLDLARSMRQDRKDIVLLFLSALNDPDTRLQGLEIGAHDYITKPFNLKELVLRLERILDTHKHLAEIPEEITHGNLKIWFKRYQVQDADQNIIDLSQKECAILEMLYKNQGDAITRDQIIEKIWGENSFPSNRTVDNYIVKLRKWTETDNSIEINSVRGIGYKLIIKN